jgi:hypothetical protein
LVGDLAAHQRFGSHEYFQLGFVASTTLPPREGRAIPQTCSRGRRFGAFLFK